MAITKETGLVDGIIFALVGMTVVSAPLAILAWLRWVLSQTFEEEGEKPAVVSERG